MKTARGKEVFLLGLLKKVFPLVFRFIFLSHSKAWFVVNFMFTLRKPGWSEQNVNRNQEEKVHRMLWRTSCYRHRLLGNNIFNLLHAERGKTERVAWNFSLKYFIQAGWGHLTWNIDCIMLEIVRYKTSPIELQLSSWATPLDLNKTFFHQDYFKFMNYWFNIMRRLCSSSMTIKHERRIRMIYETCVINEVTEKFSLRRTCSDVCRPTTEKIIKATGTYVQRLFLGKRRNADHQIIKKVCFGLLSQSDEKLFPAISRLEIPVTVNI